MVHYRCQAESRFVHQNYMTELHSNVVYVLQTEYPALFWLSVFGTVTHSFYLFVSRTTVYLGLGSGCGTHQAFNK